MTTRLNSLEKNLTKSFLTGIGTSVAVTAIEIGYILPQKPFWTGKEVAAMLLASSGPMIIGTLPTFYLAAKEIYRDIKKKSIIPRVGY